ncbi:ataxin-10-like [Pomacea canaliculata]|uniref:ataxin-10-like n=1 Tax=Pomacea canaliculata TaxID=400727 RepID=UPI000D72AE1D|nr:ataxin-10-like [Pomacea canaliculata]
MERENIENGMLAVEQMLKVTKLFDGLYCKLEPKERLFVLEILKSRLLDWEKNLGATTTLAPSEVADNSDLPVCKSNLIFLANRVSDERAEFQKLKYKDAGHNEGLLVLVKELEVLSIVTAFDSYNRLQDTPKLLRFAVDLLRDIHEAGKERFCSTGSVDEDEQRHRH